MNINIKKFNKRTIKLLLFMVIDILVILTTYCLGYYVENIELTKYNILFIIIITVIHLLVFSFFKGYRIITDNFGITDAIRFGVLIFIINVFSFLLNLLTPLFSKLSVGMFLFIFASQCLLMIGARCIQKAYKYYYRNHKELINTIIIGAGSAGKVAFDEMHNNIEFKNKVVCFADDDNAKIGKNYLGKPVVGPLTNISKYIEKYDVKEVVIAISSLDKSKLKNIISNLNGQNVKVKRLPLLAELTDPTKPFKIKEVSLVELLGRDQITFDTNEIKMWLENKTVLITGGGGSIGGQLAKQVFGYNVKKIILFDIYENAVYNVQMDLVREISKTNSSTELITLIGSTYNEFRVEEIFNKYKPDIVFHAAAYKHVPLMEDSPAEAIRTNCLGTYNIAKMCDKYNVEKMVLVSTDKAVRPTNVMGATKAFAEMIIRYFSTISNNTSFSAVRFGNVLGSNGSVIPLFKKQIEDGGPVTVTHPEIIRYFMTIPEAVSLILQSGAYAKGGEIFILDMGEPVKILDLAINVIKQSGLIPYKDIDIVFTGLRPGEKIYEELLLDVSKNIKTSNQKIFIEEPTKTIDMKEKLDYISKVFEMYDTDEIKNCLREVVTTYQKQNITKR